MAAKKRGDILERLVPVLLFASIGLAFVVGVLWQKVSSLERGREATTPAEDQVTITPEQAKVAIDQIKALFSKDLIKFGDEDRKVLFVEVSDPSCPYCHIAAGKNPELNKQAGERFKLVSDGGTYVAPVPEMKKLVEEGKASFVWIYTQGHGNGEMGTKAMYCAYEKDKFWEVHDLLMSNQGYDLINNEVKNDKDKSDKLADFLKGVIDSKFLKECLESGKYDERIGNDVALVSSLGFQGTPGFFVNEVKFAGAYSFTDMQPVVDEALK